MIKDLWDVIDEDEETGSNYNARIEYITRWNVESLAMRVLNVRSVYSVSIVCFIINTSLRYVIVLKLSLITDEYYYEYY